jgi:hypothetical protein
VHVAMEHKDIHRYIDDTNLPCNGEREKKTEREREREREKEKYRIYTRKRGRISTSRGIRAVG